MYIFPFLTIKGWLLQEERERLCLAFNLVVKGWKGKGWFERGWKGRLWFECLDLVLVFGSCFAVLGCEEGVLSLKVRSLFTDYPVLLCFPSTRKPEKQKNRRIEEQKNRRRT